MDFTRLTSNVKLLAISVVSILGLFFEFIGQIVHQVEVAVPLTSWFYLVFYVALIAGINISIINGSINNYRLAAIAFLTTAFVLVILELGVVIYLGTAGSGLKSTGLIFISFALIPWIFIFGSEPDSLANSLNVNAPAIAMPKFGSSAPVNPPVQVPVMNTGVNPHNSVYQPPVTAASPIIMGSPQTTAPTSPPLVARNGPAIMSARALYLYQANQEDPNELSFQKGEILEILDNNGKWWHARKTNPDGTVVAGIVPSNYLEPLST
ncbi:Transmembrane osmosensor [Nowakowskiella sp. JEL0407]|nr:Transmembrane osmosensor [Nowakowskiella sp. JEL0407]